MKKVQEERRIDVNYTHKTELLPFSESMQNSEKEYAISIFPQRFFLLQL
jgi:hypothetical protein